MTFILIRDWNYCLGQNNLLRKSIFIPIYKMVIGRVSSTWAMIEEPVIIKEDALHPSLKREA